MKRIFALSSLAALVWGASVLPANAQVTTTTTKTTRTTTPGVVQACPANKCPELRVAAPACPAPCPQQVSACPTPCTVKRAPEPVAAACPTACPPSLSGQITQVAPAESVDSGLFRDTINKSITLEPGEGQFTSDSLNYVDTVMLTLVNPTNVPMRFETTQRWGKELKTVVPANSQQVVSFPFRRPFSDEVKYTVFEEPQSSLNRISYNLTQGTAQATEPTITEVQTVTETTVPTMPEVQPTQGRSAVRGYW